MVKTGVNSEAMYAEISAEFWALVAMVTLPAVIEAAWVVAFVAISPRLVAAFGFVRDALDKLNTAGAAP